MCGNANQCPHSRVLVMPNVIKMSLKINRVNIYECACTKCQQNEMQTSCQGVYGAEGEGGVALPDNGGVAICNSAKNKHTRKMTGNKQNAPLVFPRVACACACVRVCVQLKCQKHAQLDRAASHAPLRPHALPRRIFIFYFTCVIYVQLLWQPSHSGIKLEVEVVYQRIINKHLNSYHI